MKLIIAIPALNEQKSIQSIIERTLAARQHIMENSQVSQVDITVVSDGSIDKTVEIASRYMDRIKLIVFERNRGYGAAIKEAWRQSDADVLGFLDADGTCDPLFFATLCTALDTERADVALGSRLNPESKMPLIRRLGNTMFALLLTTLSSKRVKDTASGMRVVRRSSLPRLMPLPDGLHFTPAMSARAMLSEHLKIVEINMPYHEREGESKLRLFKDGMRFLNVIFEATFLYRPSRPFHILGLACLIISVGLMVEPVMYYVQHESVLEWMIYRFVVSNLAATVGILFICARYITELTINITIQSDVSSGKMYRLLDGFFSSPTFWLTPVALTILGILLVVPSFLELVQTGATYEHWSRFIVMSFFLSTAFVLVVVRLIAYTLTLIRSQLQFLVEKKW